jgi:integrase
MGGHSGVRVTPSGNDRTVHVARSIKGNIRTHERADGLTTYSLRFGAEGKRHIIRLGTELDGWTHARAEIELQNTLAKIEAGIWEPPSDKATPAEEPSFHEFASRWLAARRHEIRDTTYADYRWRLVHHLLPFFADYKPSAITIALVDRYREDKLIERDETERARAAGVTLIDHAGRPRRGLSNESINKTLALLASMLDDAVERGWAASNPARGRRRRLRAPRPEGSFLEPDELRDLLAAAQHRDALSRKGHRLARREIIATLALAGLRVSELCRLRWRDVDLAHGRLTVVDAKTPAGAREVDTTPMLREILIEYRSRLADPDPTAFVFTTASGRPRDKDNVRTRVLAPCVADANATREERGLPRLPHVSPHTLRRTFISLLLANHADVPCVMDQVGHVDEGTTLRVYAKVLNRDRRHVGAAVDEMIGDQVSSRDKPPAPH